MKSIITSSTISLKPSAQLLKYLNKHGTLKRNDTNSLDISSLLIESDREFITNLDLSPKELLSTLDDTETTVTPDVLDVTDLLSLSEKLNSDSSKPYFHEIVMGSEIIYPKNEEIPRNEELEKRCLKLKRQQENKAYKSMTKDVDSVRKHMPEDTIAYQLKNLNRQLIAIGQFLISLFAGFMFGFQGIEMMVGPFDFGFRLLLGVMFSLIIALAELYFLAKKLNEDLMYSDLPGDPSSLKHQKVD